MRLKLLALCLLGICLIAPIQAQDETPIVGVQISTDAVTDGFVLFSPMLSKIAYLIDNQGNLVHQWQSNLPILLGYLLENGDFLAAVTEQGEGFPPGATGQLQRYDWDGNLIWSYDLEQSDEQIHHDIAVLPNGNILMSIWEIITPDAFSEWGINPTLVPENGANLFYDKIVELDPTNNEIVWQWRLLDHSVQDYDPSLPNYGTIAANPQRIDINYSHFPPDVQDRSHFNAIEYNAALDQILLSAHFQSEIWIIDHKTGDLLYRWGNPQAYGRGLPLNRILFNQHNPNWLDNGNILIFNNGSENFRRFTTIIEITPPLNPDGTYALLDGAAYPPNDIVWEYRAEPPESFFAGNTSGAQRLPNGNTFITDGPAGRLFEIDSRANIVWEYLSPIFTTQEPLVRTIVFRARRYLPDNPAFTNRELNPLSNIEIEFLGSG